MIINKDNSGKVIGSIDTLTSAESVVTVNQSQNVTTTTTHDRSNGQVKTEIFYGTLPILPEAIPNWSGDDSQLSAPGPTATTK
jgi:hypothetical protein